MSTKPRIDLTLEERARIAAQLEVHKERRAEVLAQHSLSEQAWAQAVAEWARCLTDEIRQRAGSAIRIEDRYPLASSYAKAYSDALAEARAELAREERDDEATIRIAPGASRDEPFSVLGASNRAAGRPAPRRGTGAG